MNICNEIEEVKEGYQHPELIPGHLYKNDEGWLGLYAAMPQILIGVLDGGYWNHKNDPFGGYDHEWTDVTDRYCLKKVK